MNKEELREKLRYIAVKVEDEAQANKVCEVFEKAGFKKYLYAFGNGDNIIRQNLCKNFDLHIFSNFANPGDRVLLSFAEFEKEFLISSNFSAISVGKIIGEQKMDIQNFKKKNLAEAKRLEIEAKNNEEVRLAREEYRRLFDQKECIERTIKANQEELKEVEKELAVFGGK